MRPPFTARALGALVLSFAIVPALGAEGGDLADGAVARLVPDPTDWLVRLPATDKLAFKGMLSGKGAGADKGSMVMYGGGLVGLLAGIATHAAISSAVLTSQQRAEQYEADKVLEPYRPTLDSLSTAKLAQLGTVKMVRGGAKRVAAPGAQAPGEWLIESTPVFTLTQDERAIVLDNAVVVRAPEAPFPAVYKGVVRVVSDPRPAGDEQSPLLAAWTASEGEALQQETSGLWAESLDMVLAELNKGPGGSNAQVTQKTIRFPEGGATKVERASIVEERCGRTVVKTLRGWLMSVPTGKSCETQASRSTP